MRIEPIGADRAEEVQELFRKLDLHLGDENYRQFCLPRTAGPGLVVGLLGVVDGGLLAGLIGYLDVPARLRGSTGALTVRWPINIYLLPAYRGSGLGVKLMEATREGARLRLVIGGNEASIPVLEKTGWRHVGALTLFRWARPCLDPRRLADRVATASRRPPPERLELAAGGRRVVVRRWEGREEDLPAAPEMSGPATENGVIRDRRYLGFAFGGPMRAHHSLHIVSVSGGHAGYFVLAARSERWPLLTAEIIDLDAVAGHEAVVIGAARRTALACADVVRLRICGERFVAAAREVGGIAREGPDLPLRVSCEEDMLAKVGDPAVWRLTYGDHDQYRVRAASRVWRPVSQAPGRS